MHGLSDRFLSDKPNFHERCEELLEFIGDSPLVAHNAAFDFGFINHELGACGRPVGLHLADGLHADPRPAEIPRRQAQPRRALHPLRRRPLAADQARRPARRAIARPGLCRADRRPPDRPHPGRRAGRGRARRRGRRRCGARSPSRSARRGRTRRPRRKWPAMPRSWRRSPIRSGTGSAAPVDLRPRARPNARRNSVEAQMDIRVSGSSDRHGRSAARPGRRAAPRHRRQIFLARHLRPGDLRQAAPTTTASPATSSPMCRRAWC